MNLQRIFFLLVIFISFLLTCSGQEKFETIEGETWVQQYGIYYPTASMTFRYDNYSKEDTVKFRNKLDLLKEAKFSDEWEGTYYSGFPDEVGTSSFRWDSNAGFVNYYIYSCFPELRFLNYGKITFTSDYIQTIPEFAADSPRKEKPVKYVKVKWGNQHYLVEESSLLAFAENAAGIYVETEDNSTEEQHKWWNHWVKSDLENDRNGLPQIERQLFDLPQFPARYKKFERLPIQTKIVSVGKRTIQKDVETAGGFTTEETAVYQVRLLLKKGIKKGMIFIIPGTSDEILVTQVNPNYVIGIISRSIDENNNDKCYTDVGDEISCPKIKSALEIKTKNGKLWF